MTSIIKATEKDYKLLSELAKLTFIESHGNSAESEDINFYVTEKYSEPIFKQELNDPQNVYYIIYHNNCAVGYSKIIMNCPYSESKINNIAKLERIYILKEFYDLKLGLKLFNFNVDLSKQNNQLGMWLFVWKDNQRAVNFYKKNEFAIIGSHNFKISETHSNPNYQMFLKF